MIDTVVFDIGDVLMHFDWDTYIEQLLGPKEAERVSDIFWQGDFWKEMDRGKRVPGAILKDLKGRFPESSVAIQKAYDGIGLCMHRHDDAGDWIVKARNLGCRVLYLSNFSTLFIDKRPDTVWFLPLFDGGLFSFECGHIKPEGAIYEAFIDKCGARPESCLFIDDRQVNLDGAAKFGFTCLLHESQEKSMAQMEKIVSAGCGI